MSELYKRNHFVPVNYLKRWYNSTEDESLYVFRTNNKKVSKSTARRLCIEKNLYTLVLEKLKHHFFGGKMVERFFYHLHETWFNELMIKTLDQNSVPTATDVTRLIWYVILQSTRTPKYYADSLPVLKTLEHKIGKVISKAEFFSFEATINSLQLKKHAYIELFQAPIGKNFITSDNPASHWFLKNGTWSPVKTLVRNTAISENKDYKIVMPLNPKWYSIVTPSINLKNSQMGKVVKTSVCTESEYYEFNKVTEMSSDRILIAKRLEDLI